MTIPIAPVHINPQFVETNKQGGGLAMLLQALQHRQELDIAKQKLKREWEQFELNKKLAGPQLEGMILQNEKKKRDLKAEEDDIAARDRALQRYTGNLSRLDDAEGVGQVIADIKDPAEAAHFFEFLKTGLATRQQQQSLGPDNQIVQSGSGQYVAVDRRNPSQSVNTGVPVPDTTPRVPPALQQKIRLGAKNAAQAIRQAVELVQRDPDANYKPVLSDIAGSAAESRLAGWVPGLKGGAGYLRRTAMSANQQKFQNLLNIVAHNAVGLLPGTRQSIVLFNNLRDSYSTDAGDSPELRAQKLAILADLGASLAALSRGEDASLAHLPGFEEFAPLGLPGAPTQSTQPSAPIRPPSADSGSVTPIRPRYHPKFRTP